ncbi:hypothetical protein SiRe_2074 [Sulfolobus islandicus REY15A]|uniref:Uncharacterized protein n=1 Tax=Saccharolobus islandicus (strain REY15A) TaxID=930945 RepID=F0NCI4_SACI5|nr:hypothetical protein SiRe_2074 [Sulfolobus islandicus REY15A]
MNEKRLSFSKWLGLALLFIGLPIAIAFILSFFHHLPLIA